MIYYDPHKWLDHFFDIRGSLVREIGWRVGSCVVWSAGVVAFHVYVRPVDFPITMHTLVGLALGLLLVFRTNASYDRYWEGRKLWGGIVNETRNMIRSAVAHFGEEKDLLYELTRWTTMFPWATMNALRGERRPPPFMNEFTKADRSEIETCQHPALYAAQRMTECTRRALEQGIVSDIIFTNLDQNTQQLVDYLGGCERIRKTPLPFAYVVHLRRALVLYCFTLPFALVDLFQWWTTLGVLLIAYTFFGIEEIGVEIEGPFGHDENDLPLEDICQTIRSNLYSVSGLGHPEREKLPEGL